MEHKGGHSRAECSQEPFPFLLTQGTVVQPNGEKRWSSDPDVVVRSSGLSLEHKVLLSRLLCGLWQCC